MSQFHFSLWQMSPCVLDFHCPFISAQTFPCSHFPAAVNNVAISMAVQVTLWVDIETSGSHKGIAGLYGSSAFGFWGVLYVCVYFLYWCWYRKLYSGKKQHTHPHQQRVKAPLSPHLSQSLSFVFLMAAILADVWRPCTTSILVCIGRPSRM